MEGSSESGWQRSESLRALRSSILARNPRIMRANNTVRVSGDNASHDSDYLSVRKGGQRDIWPHLNIYKARASGVEEGPVAGGSHAARPLECNDVSLRQWLDNPERAVDSLECIHIFSQILDIVNVSHSQGIVVHNVRPSCFAMTSFNRVSLIESALCSDSSYDSQEYTEFKGFSTLRLHDSGTQLGVVDNSHWAGGSLSHIDFPIKFETSCLAKQSCLGRPAHKLEASGDAKTGDNDKRSFPMKQTLLMESNWYTPPEQVSSAGVATCASDVYQLGVLLFELFCTSSSQKEKSSTMASMRHRVLPPHLLLKWPKEASFCLWLLHPDPNSRPKMGELLQSEFMNEPRTDLEERAAAIGLCEQIEELDMLLEFLLTLQQKKQDAAGILRGDISCISSDLEEAKKLRAALRAKGVSSLDSAHKPSVYHHPKSTTDAEIPVFSGSKKWTRPSLDVLPSPDEYSDKPGDKNHTENLLSEENFLCQDSRLLKNFQKLESAYFLTRRRLKAKGRSIGRSSAASGDGRGSMTERSSISNLSSKELNNEDRPGGWLNTFLEGLGKYLVFSKLRVKADLNQGDLLNSSNLVCSLSFNCDGDFFATAGVNKRIKVFEYGSIVNEHRDIHYPVVDMAGRSKLSSICWNGYIKSQIASSNFDGVVQLWDVNRSLAFMDMREHKRRVWSVDFSVADPTLLASGSDDGSVKLWNINQGRSVSTIRTKANVCCVQFPPDSGRTLAFGSADHMIHYYDLRNSKMPLCTFVGHDKTVSYVKFIDSTTLVSASTDNTIKLWDLSMCSSRVLDSPLQSYTGHLNLKNFVGLSVCDGYIATGSEMNEVFVYHKAFPMPAVSFKFNDTDPFSGDEMNDSAHFISSVCWRGQSTTLVAANSVGNIKILEMA